MGKWFKARWQAYLDTSDPDVAMSGSTPTGALVAPLIVLLIVLPCGYVPYLRNLTGMRDAWVSGVLACLGGVSTFLAYRNGCRGTVGSLATLVDNTFYSSALAFAAMQMRDTSALAMASVHGLSMILFPGQHYALTFLLAAVMALPLIGMAVFLQPELPVLFIMTCSTIGMLLVCFHTTNRRASARKQQDLEAALQAANTVADESVHAALTTTLLTLGHFLHELRNFQTAIASNLEYVQLHGNLSATSREALDDARAAQRRQEELVKTTLQDLRERSTSTRQSFWLSAELGRAAASTTDVEVVVQPCEFDLEVLGNPEHLGVILLNLIRNAGQAGAKRVTLTCQPESSGHAAQLLVEDDGPGLGPAQRQRLFDTFALSTKAGGSGLGLYLVRRYTELLGGRVETVQSSGRGAAFRIRLPGKVVPLSSVSNMLAASG